MKHTVEVTKEAFWLLMGNDEETWVDYKQTELTEASYYRNKGVALMALTNFISNVTQYYVQDINA